MPDYQGGMAKAASNTPKTPAAGASRARRGKNNARRK
jgi:hypothetical protein